MGSPQEGPVEEVQAVRPQALDPEAAHAVPEEVEPGVLAVKVPGLGDDEEDQAAGPHVPEALIEEGGVDLHQLAGDGGQRIRQGRVVSAPKASRFMKLPHRPMHWPSRRPMTQGPHGSQLDALAAAVRKPTRTTAMTVP